MKVLADAIEVCRPINVVFAFITDFAHVSLMFEHITHVVPQQEGRAAVGCRYRQTRRVHGVRYTESVEVAALENNRRYAIKVSSFGVEGHYSYHLAALSASATRIQLTKAAHAQGWTKLLLPLAHHVLARPEHDGRHLQVLKAAIEKHSTPDGIIPAISTGRA